MVTRALAAPDRERTAVVALRRASNCLGVAASRAAVSLFSTLRREI